MVKRKLRVRRLTLAPGALGDSLVEGVGDKKDDEAELFLPQEHLRRAVEIAVVSSSSRRTGPHVHGVVDRVRGRFWSPSSDSESEEDEGNVLLPGSGSVDHGIKLQPRGWVTQPVDEKAPNGRTTSGIVIGSKVSPWVDPLPAPRISPKLSMGDVIAKAKVSASVIHPRRSMVSSRSALSNQAAVFRGPQETETTMNAGSDIPGVVKGFRISNFKKGLGRDQAQANCGKRTGAGTKMGLHPNVPYRPVPGLVALFARQSSCSVNPRAPIVQPRAVTGFSYVAVAMHPSENGRGNRVSGSQQRFGSSASGQGSGQGAFFGKGGFPPAHQGFHPGFAGRGPYAGHGGGRYGTRGRPGGWSAQQRGGFAGRRGQGSGASEGQSMDVGTRDGRDPHSAQVSREVRDHQVVGSSNAAQGREFIPMGDNQAAAKSVGSVNVGGRSFNLPEQAAVLLQQAFELMSDSKGAKQQGDEGACAEPKGKEVTTIDSGDKVPKSQPAADGAESSRQAAARKEGIGKNPYCFRCKTKGHAIEECHASMYCDICESLDHFRVRCPKYRAVKGAAVPCGFAVEGLGFFHTPHETSVKQRTEARTALISVSDGEMSIQSIISELQRLIPGGWVWNVEALGPNSFKTVFPSRSELLRMVEWGPVHTKF
jgi:hypothetical protein